jgi:hypothetical protein
LISGGFMKKSILAFGLALLSCCSCVFNKSSNAAKGEIEVEKNQAELPEALQDFIDKATVQKEWQKVFITQFAKGGWEKGWMLFSYAGYSNRGQSGLYKKGEQLDYYYAVPNENSKYELLTLTEKKKDAFLKNIGQYEALKDYRRTSFDGMSYEFVTIEKKESGFDVKRFYMNSLGLHNDDKEYRALVGLFSALNK